MEGDNGPPAVEGVNMDTRTMTTEDRALLARREYVNACVFSTKGYGYATKRANGAAAPCAVWRPYPVEMGNQAAKAEPLKRGRDYTVYVIPSVADHPYRPSEQVFDILMDGPICYRREKVEWPADCYVRPLNNRKWKVYRMDTGAHAIAYLLAHDVPLYLMPGESMAHVLRAFSTLDCTETWKRAFYGYRAYEYQEEIEDVFGWRRIRRAYTGSVARMCRHFEAIENAEARAAEKAKQKAQASTALEKARAAKKAKKAKADKARQEREMGAAMDRVRRDEAQAARVEAGKVERYQ